MPDPVEIPADVAAVLAALAEARPMRRGAITTRTMKCGQRSCTCRDDPAARHGPYTEWSRVVGGRRLSRYLSAGQVEHVRRQIASGHDFRKLVEQLWEAAERWADSELQERTAAPDEGGKKGGSRRSSKRRS